MTRFFRSLTLAAAASLLVVVIGVLMHAAGFQFTTAAAPVINMFLLVLLLVQKEINYEAGSSDLASRAEQIVSEIAEEKAAILTLSKGYEALTRDHQQLTQQALGKIEETAEQVEQAIGRIAPGAAGEPAPGCKPENADRRAGGGGVE